MSRYKYVALNTNGDKVSGERSAEQADALVKALSDEGLTVLKLAPVHKAQRRAVTSQAIESFSAQWARQLRHKVKADKALEIISQGSEGLAVGHVASSLLSDVREGASVSSALEARPNWFDRRYQLLCKAGEASGNLAQALTSITEQQRFNRELRNKLAQATVYPSVIMVVCLAAILFVLVGIVPRMSGLFDEVAQLPGYTRLLLMVSAWLQNNLSSVLLLGVLGGVALLSKDVRAAATKLLSGQIHNVPIIGGLVAERSKLEFLSSMATLLGSRVPLMQSVSLSISSESQLGKYKEKILAAVSDGQGLVAALRLSPVLSAEELSVLEAAEPTASLPEAFLALSEEGKLLFEGRIEKVITLETLHIALRAAAGRRLRAP